MLEQNKKTLCDVGVRYDSPNLSHPKRIDYVLYRVYGSVMEGDEMMPCAGVIIFLTPGHVVGCVYVY